MSTIKFAGPLLLRLSSFLALNKIAISTYARRMFGQRIEPSWDTNLEIGVRFTRHQFTRAMTVDNIAQGRVILDSLQTQTPDIYAVNCIHQATPKGKWYVPHHSTSRATILYFHGGGYAFHGAMSVRFAEMLAHHTGASVFTPDYRLIPEHPHPAQAHDARAAWDFVAGRKQAKEIVVIGDSAGGHMMLNLLRELKQQGREQPSLGIGLCPWTDIGERGQSLYQNDRYDLVQGWMAIQFGKWLDPKEEFGRTKLSPISYDYNGVAPIYLQAGGREILHDMIYDFAKKQVALNADLLLDVWPSMPHNFQLMDSTQDASVVALERIAAVIRFTMKQDPVFPPDANTVVASGVFDKTSDR